MPIKGFWIFSKASTATGRSPMEGRIVFTKSAWSRVVTISQDTKAVTAAVPFWSSDIPTPMPTAKSRAI